MPTFETVVESHVQRWLTRRRLREQARKEFEQRSEPRTVPPSITISYAQGSGGDEIGEAICDSLDFQLYDREIVDAITQSTKAQSQLIELLDQGGQNLISTFTEQLFNNRIIDDRSYTHTLSRIVRTLSLLNPAVFIGRGACHILRESEAFHVRITAEVDDRVRRTMEREGGMEEEALDKVRTDDQMRQRFIRNNFNRDINDPTAYHLVINTSRISWLDAADLILTLYRERPLTKAELDGLN